MTELKAGNYNAILHSGKDLLILLYDPSGAAAEYSLNQMRQIDQMIGKNFLVCTVNTLLEPEISAVLPALEIPTYISIKQTKIHKSITGMRSVTEILRLMQ